MLVLTRRENDRIDFPGLGISIEVLRLTRARAALGIVAPKNVKIIRHELLEESGTTSTCDQASSLIRQELAARIKDEIDSAKAKMKVARKDLMAGNTADALSALSEALAELDALSSPTNDAAEGQPFDSPRQQQGNHWDVAGGVAESQAGYSDSAVRRRMDRQRLDRPSADRGRVRCVIGSRDMSIETLADAIRGQGFEVDRDGDSLRLLAELVQRQKDDAVLLVSSQSDPESILTLALVPDSSRHPGVPILFADDVATTSGNQVTASRGVSPTTVG